MTPAAWFLVGVIAGGAFALWLFPPHIVNINEPKLKVKNSSDIDAAQSLSNMDIETIAPPKARKGFLLFRPFKKKPK